MVGLAGFIVLMFIVLILSPFFIMFFGIHYNTGEGEHNGYITAAETTGVFFKVHSVYVKTDTQSSQEDRYCVVDPEVFAQLQEAVSKKEHVVISYFSWFAPASWECSGNREIINKASLAN